MMKVRVGFVLIVCFILIGCQPKEQRIVAYEDFPEQCELKAITIELDTAIFRYPFRMRAQDDKIVVMDLHNADYYFHLFSYPGFAYVSSFGKRGESPEEMLAAENFRFAGEGGKEIRTLDSSKSRINRLSFSLSRDSLLPAGTIALDKDVLRPLDFCLYNDSVMIIPDFSGENRFCFVDESGKLLYKQGQIPASDQAALSGSKPALSQAWRSFVDYNPRRKVLAAVTQLGEVLEIYNFNDQTQRVIVGPNGEPEFQEQNGYAIPSGIMGFSDIQVTDNYIYTVFHGQRFKDMPTDPSEFVDGGQYIYVFDLKGNPVRKYVLDRHINGFFVDEKEQIVYATDVNNDQPLVYFSL
ncbi:MAG: TolB-like 6-bladed beta-propeller domain-containing protein [Mediterranea sp.]|jgi:hypothetical protein|nr:TolB-like 6-bladed beta-propeller domain-containing protein [Mediterranea sp.]